MRRMASRLGLVPPRRPRQISRRLIGTIRTRLGMPLSISHSNSLKNANIHTLRDLVRRSEKDMLETKNFGKKSLEEVQEVLDKLGLSLGMEVPERPGSGASA